MLQACLAQGRKISIEEKKIWNSGIPMQDISFKLITTVKTAFDKAILVILLSTKPTKSIIAWQLIAFF